MWDFPASHVWLAESIAFYGLPKGTCTEDHWKDTSYWIGTITCYLSKIRTYAQQKMWKNATKKCVLQHMNITAGIFQNQHTRHHVMKHTGWSTFSLVEQPFKGYSAHSLGRSMSWNKKSTQRLSPSPKDLWKSWRYIWFIWWCFIATLIDEKPLDGFERSSIWVSHGFSEHLPVHPLIHPASPKIVRLARLVGDPESLERYQNFKHWSSKCSSEKSL